MSKFTQDQRNALKWLVSKELKVIKGYLRKTKHPLFKLDLVMHLARWETVLKKI